MKHMERSEEFPLVSLITVNYNQYELTRAFLASVKLDPYPNKEVIVVDNGSGVNENPRLETEFPSVIFLRSDKNLGFAGGNNLGIKRASGAYLYFVNNDTELRHNSIAPVLDILRRNRKIGIVSPKIIYFFSDQIIQFAGSAGMNPWSCRSRTLGQGEQDRGQHDELRETPIIDGAAMMVPSRVIQQVGLMPEEFFLYYEELDWCEQIKRAGFKAYYQGHASILHKESMSVGKASPLKTYFMNRNRLLFIRRNFKGVQRLSASLFFLAFALPKAVLGAVWRREWSHAKALFKAVFWNFRYRRHLN